jgi:hypothetical protein
MAENQTIREMIEAVGKPLTEYRFLILDEDGKTPKITDFASGIEWAQNTCNEGISYRLKLEEFDDSAVSTVFISGIVLSDDSPILNTPFETMIIAGLNEGYKRCYKTFDDAVTGHDDIVRELKHRLHSRRSL